MTTASISMRRCIDVATPQNGSRGYGRTDVEKRLGLLGKTMRVYDWLLGVKLVLRQKSKQRRSIENCYPM